MCMPTILLHSYFSIRFYSVETMHGHTVLEPILLTTKIDLKQVKINIFARDAVFEFYFFKFYLGC